MKLTNHIAGAVRTAVLSLVICCVAYTAVIWLAGEVFFPFSARGSLVQNRAGQYVGSRLIAQKFTQDKYFHPRPSAAGFDGTKSSGSNLAPGSPVFKERVQRQIKKYGASPANPLPLDLATASGSGLDPHITLKGALFQIKRVAAARKMSQQEVMKIVKSCTEYPGVIMRNEPVLNVLLLNLALDEQQP